MAQNQINFKIGFQTDKAGLEQLQAQLKNIATQAKTVQPGKEINESLKAAGATAQELSKILDSSINANLGTLNVAKFQQELTKAGMSAASLRTSLAGAGNTGADAFNLIRNKVLNAKMEIKETNQFLNQMATTMANTIRWSITSTIINAITGSIQKAVGYTEDLNTSLNDIRIVTEKSANSMERFAKSANTAAKNLGASTLDYTEASLIYYQQGLSDSEAQARAETTIKAANVTGQSAQTVSEQLTAVWNGYKVSAQEAELYVDKLAAVAGKTAADLEELSTGMSKVASAANSMGVDVDQLNAQLATIISVTRQAPESVGTALKTIYARMGDLEVDGQDEFGVSLGEVSGTLESLGIEVLDMNGELRDMGEVMTEVGEKWNTWNDAQQQAIAISMAGKRQYNNLIALFENWDMYSDALETSVNSMGTLQKQQDIYMESTAAKLERLGAAWEDLYSGLIKDDEKNTVIDALTGIVEAADRFIDSFGGGLKSITALGVIMAQVFRKQIGAEITRLLINTEKMKKNRLQMQALQQWSAIDAATPPNKNMAGEDSPATATQRKRVAIERAQRQTVEARARLGHTLGDEQLQDLMTMQEKITTLAEREFDAREKIKSTLKDIQEIQGFETVSEETSVEDREHLIETARAQQKQQELEAGAQVQAANDDINSINKQINSLDQSQSGTNKARLKVLSSFDPSLLESETEAQVALEVLNASKEESAQTLLTLQEKITAELQKQKKLAEEEKENAEGRIVNAQHLNAYWQDQVTENQVFIQTSEKDLQKLTMAKKYLLTQEAQSPNAHKFSEFQTHTQNMTDLAEQYGMTDAKTALQHLSEDPAERRFQLLDIERQITDEIQRQKESREQAIAELRETIQINNERIEQEREIIKTATNNITNIDNKTQAITSATTNEEKASALLSAVDPTSTDLSQKELQLLEKIKAGKLDNKQASEELLKIEQKIKKALEERLATAKKELQTGKDNLATAKKRKKEIEDAEKHMEEYTDAVDDATNATNDLENANQENAAIIETMAKGAKVQNVFQGITASLTMVTTAWSSFQQLGSIWSEEDLTVTEKIMQSLMAITPIIYGLTSGINTLRQVTGLTTAAQAMNTVVVAANNAELQKELGLRGSVTAKQLQAVLLDKIEEQAIKSQTGEIQKNDMAQKVNSMSKKEKIKWLATASKADIMAALGVKTETAAVKAATGAQWAWNASLMANPIVLIVVAIVAAVAALTALTAALIKANHAAKIEDAKQRVEQSKKIEEQLAEEKKAVDELVSSYESLQKAYLEQDSTLDDLQKGTYNLLLEYGELDLAVKALSADYEELNNIVQKLDIDATNQNLKATENTLAAINYQVGLEEGSGWDQFWRDFGEAFSWNSLEYGNNGQWSVVDETGGSTQTSKNLKAIRSTLEDYGFTVSGNGSSISIDNIDKIFSSKEKADEVMALLRSTGVEMDYLERMYEIYEETGKFEQLNLTENLRKEALAEQEVQYGDIQSADDFINEYNNLVGKAKTELGMSEEDAKAWAMSYISVLEEAQDFVIEASLKLTLNPDSDPVITAWLTEKTVEEQSILAGMTGLGVEGYQDTADQYVDYIQAKNRQNVSEDIEQFQKDLLSKGEMDEETWSTFVSQIGTTLTDQDTFTDSKGITTTLKEVLQDFDKYSLQDQLAVLNQLNIGTTNAAFGDWENNVQGEWTAKLTEWQTELTNYMSGSVLNLEEVGLTEGTRTGLTEWYKNREAQYQEEMAQATTEQERAIIQQNFEKDTSWMTANTQEDRVQALMEHYGLTEADATDFLTRVFGDPSKNINEFLGALDVIRQDVEDLELDPDKLKMDQILAVNNQLETSYARMQSALNLVNSGLIVEKDNITELGRLYPQLLQDAEFLADGSIKINETVFQSFKNNADSMQTELETQIAETEKLYEEALLKGNMEDVATLAAELSSLHSILGWLNIDLTGLDEALEIDDDLKAYNRLEKQLNKINRQYDTLVGLQDKLSGQAAINNLEKQNDLLSKRIDLYNKQIEASKKEAGILQSRLTQEGFVIDNGFITNYSEQLLVIREEQGQEAYEFYKDLLDQYEALALEKIPDWNQAIIDDYNQKLENSLEQFHEKLNIQVNIKEAKDALRKLNKAMSESADTALGQATSAASLIRDLQNPLLATNAEIATITNELDAMAKGQLSSMYQLVDAEGNVYNNHSLALEELKTSAETMVEYLTELKDAQKNLEQAFVDMMDEASDAMDRYQDSVQSVLDMIDHQMSMIDLVYGEEAYAEKEEYYIEREKRLTEQLVEKEKEADFWWARAEDAKAQYGEDSEQYQTAIDNWTETFNEIAELTEERAQAMIDIYLNSVDKVFKNIENQLTNGLGFGTIAEEWEMIQKKSDGYLDTVNAIYKIQTLENKYLQAIDQSDNIKAQKQIKTVMDEELKLLREKDKLSEYDVQRAELNYQILLKTIALQDAQQVKSKMRLTRDANGGYSYKFVADENNIASIEQELADLNNQLYNLDKDEYENGLDDIFSLTQEMLEKMAEVWRDYAHEPELAAEKAAKIQEDYNDIILAKVEENTVLQQRVTEGAIEAIKNSAKLAADDFMSLTEADLNQLIKIAVPGLRTGIQELATNLSKTGGFYTITQSAFVELNTQLTTLAENLEAANLDTKYEIFYERMNKILEENDSVIDTYIEQFENLKLITDELTAQIPLLESLAAGYAKAAEQALALYCNQHGIDKDGNPLFDITNDDLKDDDLKEEPIYIEAAKSGFADLNKDGIIDQSDIDLLQKSEGEKFTGVSIKDINQDNKIDATDTNLLSSIVKGGDNNSYYNAESEYRKRKSFYENELKTSSSIENDMATSIANSKPNNNSSNSSDIQQISEIPLKVGDIVKLTDDPEIRKKFGTTYVAACYADWQDDGSLKIQQVFPTYFTHDALAKVQIAEIADRALYKGTYSKWFKLNGTDLWMPLEYFERYDTGGYTGAWGTSDGRLALLHEKELVLNKTDTSNILSAVSIMRDITSALSASMNLQIADKMSRVLSASDFEQAETAPMEQNVRIEAHFPNVSNSKEIEEAFDNLVLRASQAALKNPNR